MALLSAVYPIVRLYCKSVPEITMDQAILHSAREFCRLSWYVQETLLVPEQDLTSFYILATSTPTQTEVLGVKAIQRDDRPLAPASFEYLRQTTGTPRWFLFEPPDVINLEPYPDASKMVLTTLKVRVAVQPLNSATTLPDALVSDFGEALGYGAISYLASIPGEIWTNDKVSLMAKEKYYQGMRMAKSNALFNHNPWNSSIQLQRFNV